MLRKIISGGQTGVDRAALDVALEFGIPCGGWCPKGRRAEDGMVPDRYWLRETKAFGYNTRTRLNARDSDGTLVLNRGPLEGGTLYTVRVAREMDKPCLVVDLAAENGLEEASHWLRHHNIQVLNVAGPRESKQSGVHDQALEFLRRLLNGV